MADKSPAARHGSPSTRVHDDLSPDSATTPAMDPADAHHANLSEPLTPAIQRPPSDGFVVHTELANLRHKLRLLERFARDHHLPTVPTVSPIDEARSLEDHIEFIETVCLKHGHDLRDLRVVDGLNVIGHFTPPGFGSWLRHNLSTNDPALQLSSEQDHSPDSVPHDLSAHRPRRPFRCPDETCIHYIYGFPDWATLEWHCKSHTVQSTHRHGPAASIDTAPRSVLLRQDPQHACYPPSLESRTLTQSQSPLSPTHPPPLHPLSFGTSLQLPPLAKVAPSAPERTDLLQSYSISSDLSGRRRPSGPDPDVDQKMPPMKRSRMGPARLESIGELRLLQERDACLSCRSLRRECDKNDPCSVCFQDASAQEHSSFWPALGCRRGPLSMIATALVPASLSPEHITQTPMTSPCARNYSMTEYLENTYVFQEDASRLVQNNLDFDDGFWWTEHLAAYQPTDPAQAPFATESMGRPPPILRLLAASQNMAGCTYNFWQLLKLSGLLSTSRRDEAFTFPVLYSAKLLLREVLFFDLQQRQPAVRANRATPIRTMSFDARECHARYRILVPCTAQYLQSLEHLASRGQEVDPRTWLAMFFSLCIFSMVRTLLVDLASSTCQSAVSLPLHAVYMAAVTMFIEWVPSFFDSPSVGMTDEDGDLYNTALMIVKRTIWPEGGIDSTRDFLLHLGNKELNGGGWHGFVRQRTFTPRNSTKSKQTVPESLPATMLPETTKYWGSPHKTAAVGTALVTSPQNGIPHGYSRGHSSINSSRLTYARDASDYPAASPPRASNDRQLCNLQPYQRHFCKQCNERPEGFPGEHELLHHMDARHKTATEQWICAEPPNYASVGMSQPQFPLSVCPSCTSQKTYATSLAATDHLRQAHFNLEKATVPNSEWPPMFVLRDWLKTARVSSKTLDDGTVLGKDCIEPSSSAIPARNTSSPLCHIPRVSPTQPDLDGRNPVLPPPPSPLLLEGRHSAPCLPVAKCRPSDSPSEAPPAAYRQHLSPVHVPETPTPLLPISSVRTQAHHQGCQPLQSQQSQQLQNPPNTANDTIPPDGTMGRNVHAASTARNLRTFLSSPNTTIKFEDGRQGNRNRCPYPECGRVFKDLPAHMITHMEERPEKCPIESCEYHIKGFARKYDKNRHALTHYKGTMVCPFCHRIGAPYQKAFNRADVFKRHLTAVHSVEQMPPNSKKATASMASNRSAVGPTGGGDSKNSLAKCSICHNQFLSAQEFYEHLDDCVLNVIIPPMPKDIAPMTTEASVESSPTIS